MVKFQVNWLEFDLINLSSYAGKGAETCKLERLLQGGAHLARDGENITLSRSSTLIIYSILKEVFPFVENCLVCLESMFLKRLGHVFTRGVHRGRVL